MGCSPLTTLAPCLRKEIGPGLCPRSFQPLTNLPNNKSEHDFFPKFIGPASMRVHRELRNSLDPHGILNPGKMVD